MASIQKRETKKGHVWRAVIRIKGYPPTCKNFDRKQEAEDWAKEIERQIKLGQFRFDLHKKIHTFDDLVDRFIADGKLDLHKSFKDTQRHLKYWQSRIGKYGLVHITSDLISKERLLLKETPTKKGSKTVSRSPATVNRYISSLSAILSFAKELQWINENPCRVLQKFKESKGRDRTLSYEEKTRLLLECKKSSNPYLYPTLL
ncbi:MAG TPA: hypothetical protein P5048_02440, partial [Chlamydiales bacterium]|nr:hypothetical protein [Chlamydiales bacterium]